MGGGSSTEQQELDGDSEAIQAVHNFLETGAMPAWCFRPTELVPVILVSVTTTHRSTLADRTPAQRRCDAMHCDGPAMLEWPRAQISYVSRNLEC